MKEGIFFDWLGLTWEKKEFNGLTLLILPNQDKSYYKRAMQDVKFILKSIKAIKKLKLFSITPLVQFALFPDNIFVEKTRVPFSWAAGCVRSTDGKNSNVFCYRHTPNHDLSLKKISADKERGGVHEALHLFLSQQLKYKDFPKSINEGFCEFVPRVLMNLQKNIKESSNYLQSLEEKDIVLFNELDKNGMAPFSKEIINKNRAYASAFLGVFWLVSQFKDKETLLENTKEFIKFLSKYETSSQLYDAIKQKTGLDLQNSKQPIMDGLKILKEIA